MKKVIMNVVQTYMVLLEPAFSAQAPQYYQHRIYVIDTDCRQVNFKRMFKYSISYLLRFKVSYSVHTIYVENDINNKYIEVHLKLS